MARGFWISYSDTDLYWARWIADELGTLGHYHQLYDFHSSSEFDRMIDRHACLLLVVSRDYLKQYLEQLQMHSSLWRAARDKRITILFVVVAQCELPMLAPYVRLCTLSGMAQDAARNRFHQFINETETVAFGSVASTRLGTGPPIEAVGLPIEALMSRHQELEPAVNMDMSVTDEAVTAAIREARIDAYSKGRWEGEWYRNRATRQTLDYTPPSPIQASAPSRSIKLSRMLAISIMFGWCLTATTYIFRHELGQAVDWLLKFVDWARYPITFKLWGITLVQPPPAAPPDLSDVVHASTFAPTTCLPGEDILVQLFLHTPEKGRAVGILAREADPEAKRRGVTVLELSVQRGQRVDVLLEAAGVEIDEPQQSLIWNGQPHSCQFVLSMPGVLSGRACLVKASIFVNSIPVGKLRFTIGVGGDAPTRGIDMVGTVARRYREAFLSHSHEDRVKVFTFAQVLDLLGIKYFQDIASIKTMEDWEWQIRQAIDRCDVFLLFWTKSAAFSEYVDRETWYAFQRQKASANDEPDIFPVFLEPEAPVPPWFLRSRQFDSLLRLAMRGAEAERQEKSV